MPATPKRLLKIALLLLFAIVGGCGFLQPVTETVATTAVMQLPGSFEQLETHVHCLEHARTIHGQETESERTAALNREVDEYRELVGASLVYRAETVQLVDRLQALLDARKPLPGSDLVALNAGLAEHLQLRQRLYEVAQSHECWLDARGAVAQLTPQQRLKGTMLSLSAAMVLYDNYLLAISLYQEEPRLRLLLNNKDIGYDIEYGELNRMALSFASEEKRNRVRRAIAWYEAAIVEHPDAVGQDPYLAYLERTINQSPSYSMTKQFSPLAFMGRKIEFYVPFTVESLVSLKDESVNMVSMIFGNSIGLVESRKGKLYRRRDVQLELEEQLRAGDILVERTPFRLTDSFIPGYWGHAAIWVGSEVELRDLGIWDHPVIQPYQDDIRSGRRVVEALRPGVEMNSLQHFLNIDDLAVLREHRPLPHDKAHVVGQALREVGKHYDFNYDLHTRDRLGCAELVYHAYGHIDWPSRRELGRLVIAPDDIAARAVGDARLDIIALYVDGERVSENQAQVMAGLIR
ncbi:MAG: YiiX/YebB-like N1pC/P60 family cysteine hydrolase [Sedimenticolaceae bacterium]